MANFKFNRNNSLNQPFEQSNTSNLQPESIEPAQIEIPDIDSIQENYVNNEYEIPTNNDIYNNEHSESISNIYNSNNTQPTQNYTLLASKILKNNARENLAGRLLESSLLTIVYGLIIVLLVLGSMLFAYKSMMLFAIICILMIPITILVGSGLHVGFLSYFMNMHNGNARFSDLFTNFSLWWGYFKVNFLSGLKVMLWSLIPFAGIYFGPKAALSYSMAPYIFIDSKKGARECIKISKKVTEGNKLNILVFILSYIGWTLLASLFGQICMTSSLSAGFMPKIQEFTNLSTMNFDASAIDKSMILSLFSNIIPPFILIYVISCITLFFVLAPLMSYISMGMVEVYYNLKEQTSYIVKDKVRQSTKEKILLIFSTLGLSILLTIASIGITSKAASSLINSIQKLPTTSAPQASILNSEWICDEDNSYLVINNNTFSYYKSKDDLTDNYLKGNLTEYNGNDAVKLLLEDKTELGITEEEITRVYGDNIDALKIWIVSNIESKVDGSDSQVEYCAYMIIPNNDDKLHLLNMVNGSQYTFSPYSKSTDTIIEEESDDTDNKKETPSEQSATLAIKYTIPNNYKLDEDGVYSGENVISLFYTDDSDDSTYKLIGITEISDSDRDIDINEEYYTDIKDYTTKHKIKGKMYKAKDYDSYGFNFIKDGKYYEIESADKDDLIKLIDSIQ